MEIWIIAAVVAWVLRNPADTVRAAAEYRKAKNEAPARAPKSARKRGAMRGFLWTVWDAKWDEAARKYPERMAKAQQRREARKAKRAERWKAVEEAAGRRWDERRARREAEGAEPAPEPAEPATGEDRPEPEADPGGADVVDLDARRARRGTAEPATGGDTDGPEPEPAPEPGRDDTDPAPDSEPEPADALGDRPEPEAPDTTEGTMPVALNLSDSATLDAHLTALRSTGDYMNALAADMERLAAGMRSHDMGEATVNTVDAARDADTEAAEALKAAADELENANRAVDEAYRASADAADGRYQTAGQ